MSVVICKICGQTVDTDYDVEHGFREHSVPQPCCKGKGCPVCAYEGEYEPEWM